MNQERVLSIIRNILTIVGGYFLGKAIFGVSIDDNLWQGIVGAILSVIGTVWSILDKSVTVEKLEGTIRHIVSVIGGIVVSLGKASPEAIQSWLGVILVILPIVFGSLSRQKAQQVQSGDISVHNLKSK